MTKSNDPRQITLLDLVSQKVCERCGGTILAPTIGGVRRGTCHCPSAEDVAPRMVRGKPKDCCLKVIAHYERDYPNAEVAKQRGASSVNRGSRVALHCKECTARLEFDGKWIREAGQ